MTSTPPLSRAKAFARRLRSGALLFGGIAGCVAASTWGASPAATTPGDSRRGFDAEPREGRLVLRVDGKPAAEFVYRDARILRPYFAAVHAPNGVQVTRRHPPVPGVDATDHGTMHPGVWLAFGDISGEDFWRNKGRIEHERFLQEPRNEAGTLVFATESRLVDSKSATLGRLILRLRLIPGNGYWDLDWVAELRGEGRELVFGDQEEMGLGARVATPIAEKNGGRLRSSEGRQTAATTWGRAADWCDYSGAVDGQPAGITLMADPKNFRASWWHNRDYGLFVANPFGRASMRQGEISTVRVAAGETLVLRFGVRVHGGDGYEPEAAYREFVARRPR